MSTLAKPGEPYVSPRGEMVVKTEEEVDAITRVDTFIPVLRKMQINNRRSIADLPCSDPSEQTAVNAIMIYQLLGLTPIEIGGVLRLPLEVVQNIQNGSEYQNTFEDVFNELISTHSNSIRARVAAFATEAVDNVIDLARNGKKEIVKLKANQDLLDRAGFSSEATIGGTDDTDALKIVIEDSGGSSTKVEVDLGKLRKR